MCGGLCPPLPDPHTQHTTLHTQIECPSPLVVLVVSARVHECFVMTAKPIGMFASCQV